MTATAPDLSSAIHQTLQRVYGYDRFRRHQQQIIEELIASRHSERQGRVIDHDQVGSMEKKKQEGYF